ncbi:MAG: DUF1697 domain-containing protein [Acidaminobacteraceae bacterium]
MYIAFLRSINVGKINKIGMSELIELFYKLGHDNIKAYLNTGNLIFDSESSDICKMEEEIRNIIFENLNLEIEILIRTSDELSKIVSNYNFQSPDGKNRYVTLLKTELDDELKGLLSEDIKKFRKEDDLYEIRDKEVNLYIPGGYGETKLNNKFIEKKSKLYATTRNINTLEKILNLIQ